MLPRALLIFIILPVFSLNVSAQKSFSKKSKGIRFSQKSAPTYKTPKVERNKVSWQADRLEYIVGVGPSGYLGDLGGQDSPGKPLFYDLEPTSTRYSGSLGARYFLREYHAIRASLNYALLQGDDALTEYPNRKFRNINFTSKILEFSAIYEWHIIKAQYLHMTGARTTKVFNGNRLGLYLFSGLGLFRFNPKSSYNGENIKLFPLHTEGQGLPGGPKQYKRIGICTPIGVGVNFLLNKNFWIGADFSYRWTTTDYLDDVSGYYYNNDAIRAEYGDLAALMANPSVLLPNNPHPFWYTQNQPRGGGAHNDTYLFGQVTLSHSLTPSISNKRFKSTKGKKSINYGVRKKDSSHRGAKANTYSSNRIKLSRKHTSKINLGKVRKNKKRRGVRF